MIVRKLKNDTCIYMRLILLNSIFIIIFCITKDKYTRIIYFINFNKCF